MLGLFCVYNWLRFGWVFLCHLFIKRKGREIYSLLTRPTSLLRLSLNLIIISICNDLFWPSSLLWRNGDSGLFVEIDFLPRHTTGSFF